MKFAYHASMCNPAFYPELAQAAEAAGYDSFTLPDSICYPREADSRYPYNDDGSREFLDGVPFLEPFSAVPWMAAVTTTSCWPWRRRAPTSNTSTSAAN